MPDITVIAVIASCAAIFVLVIVLQRLYWKRRGEQWEQVAMQLGFAVVGPESSPMEALAGFELTNRGRSRKVRCAVRGVRGGGEVLVADYQYTTGGGRNSRTHRQTVCLVRNDKVSLAKFLLRPERAILDRIGEIFGAKDIDFDDDPEFSRRFVLRGDDETAVRALFTPAVRSQLLHQPSVIAHLEGRGGSLLLHRGRFLDPEKAGELVQQTTDLARLLAGM